MSSLRITYITVKKPSPGFTGVGTTVDGEGYSVAIIANDAATLANALRDLAPNFPFDPDKFENMTVVQVS